MADQDTHASPQDHSKHQRYRRLARVRHSHQFEEFLVVQAARLGTSPAAIFAFLNTNTADQITAAATKAALKGEPAGH